MKSEEKFRKRNVAQKIIPELTKYVAKEPAKNNYSKSISISSFLQRINFTWLIIALDDDKSIHLGLTVPLLHYLSVGANCKL